jgi:hypothetical protein
MVRNWDAALPEMSKPSVSVRDVLLYYFGNIGEIGALFFHGFIL